jgi:sugar lactone lactonase YvrE
MKKFMAIWVGELISSIGSGMTAFAVSIYVYQLTGSATWVSAAALLAYLPTILLSPVGGILADRYDRRLMMVLGDSLSALGLLFNPQNITMTFISVQSVVADGRGTLWILDTAAPNFSEPIKGGAKLVAVDLETNTIRKVYNFTEDVVLPTTYLNDVRFDFRVGKAGYAYITDSSSKGPGAIIVVDLENGNAFRRLNGANSTSPDPYFLPKVEGEVLMNRNKDGSTSPFRLASDGIAISPDGKLLFFCPLTSRYLFSISTEALRDRTISDMDLLYHVKYWGEKGASDGMITDAKGNIYAGDYENNSIRKILPNGTMKPLHMIQEFYGQILFQLVRSNTYMSL